MKSPRKISRRQFLYETNCAAVGTASLFSSLFTLRLTAGAVSGTPPAGYKALVCLFLSGGNDSYNMLVPRTTSAYNQYLGIRGYRDPSADPSTWEGLALAPEELLPSVVLKQ